MRRRPNDFSCAGCAGLLAAFAPLAPFAPLAMPGCWLDAFSSATTQSSIAVISTAVPHVQAGKVRGIAVTSTRRAEAVLDVPTIAEAGVKAYAATNWYGLHAPAKMPPQAINRLSKELVAVLKSPDIVQQLKDRGIEATPTSPAEYAKFIRDEEAK